MRLIQHLQHECPVGNAQSEDKKMPRVDARFVNKSETGSVVGWSLYCLGDRMGYINASNNLYVDTLLQSYIHTYRNKVSRHII